MKRNKSQIIIPFLMVTLFLSCATPYGDGQLKYKGRSNYLLQLAKPLAPKRVVEVYDNSVVKTHRPSSDCQPFCPKVDIWQYQYKALGGKVIVSDRPISSKKEYWKNKFEARIIALSLFGQNPIYLDGMFEFLESMNYIKNMNHMNDPLWGYETFTVRVYAPKRNPARVKELGELKAELPEDYVRKLLDHGIEVVFVDNERKTVGVDAFFWRFMVTAEDMPEGETIRYLIRDADWKLTAGEAFAVGEWVASGLDFHRMNLAGACLTPVTGTFFGGKHSGQKSLFRDLHTFIQTYPYRLEYGDDELFIRDIMWPRMKYDGSILTHYALSGWKTWFGNPYVGSCEQPTQAYCNAIKEGGTCEDRELPENIIFPAWALGMRATLAELKKNPEYFEMHLDSPRGEVVREALSVDYRGEKKIRN